MSNLLENVLFSGATLVVVVCLSLFCAKELIEVGFCNEDVWNFDPSARVEGRVLFSFPAGIPANS